MLSEEKINELIKQVNCLQDRVNELHPDDLHPVNRATLLTMYASLQSMIGALTHVLEIDIGTPDKGYATVPQFLVKCSQFIDLCYEGKKDSERKQTDT